MSEDSPGDSSLLEILISEGLGATHKKDGNIVPAAMNNYATLGVDKAEASPSSGKKAKVLAAGYDLALDPVAPKTDVLNAK